MRREIKAGSTSQMLPVFIQDTSSSIGAGLGSLLFNTSGLTAKYRREGQSSWTTITLATATLGTWSSGGFISDSSGVTGDYEFGIPDAALASGATWVRINLYGTANMLPVQIEITLIANDKQDAVRMGLTALPNAAANANGGLPILSSSGTTLGYTVTTVTTVNGLGTGAITATSIAADAITAAKLAADVTTEIQSGLAMAAALTTIDGKVNAIKAKTDNLPNDPADASDVASAFSTVNSTLSTLVGYVDTEVAAIKTVTDRLDTTLELDGSVYRFTVNALEQGAAGGSSTVYVYPLSSTLPPSTILSSGTTQGFQFTPLPSGPIAIFDANGDPIDLAGGVLQMILTKTTDPTDIVTLTSGASELTVGGTDSNQVSVDYTPTFSGEYEWKLYRQEANPEDWTVLAIGFWNIEVGEDPA